MLICQNPKKQVKTPESRIKKGTFRLQQRLAMGTPFLNTSKFLIFAIKSQSQDFSYLCMRRHSAVCCEILPKNTIVRLSLSAAKVIEK